MINEWLDQELLLNYLNRNWVRIKYYNNKLVIRLPRDRLLKTLRIFISIPYLWLKFALPELWSDLFDLIETNSLLLQQCFVFPARLQIQLCSWHRPIIFGVYQVASTDAFKWSHALCSTRSPDLGAWVLKLTRKPIISLWLQRAWWSFGFFCAYVFWAGLNWVIEWLIEILSTAVCFPAMGCPDAFSATLIYLIVGSLACGYVHLADVTGVLTRRPLRVDWHL